ncbi:MAG: NADH:ubiquinone oxidoreductase [Eggerthellaceae bacterium]|nr:NADH:ubiquinone oxidoreductase [Eggerthellaceae bacterium]
MNGAGSGVRAGSGADGGSCSSARRVPRVVVVGLASCFGCQLQITNQERYLLDVLGQIDLRYWQLASSDPMPDEFDVAIIEGAVTNREACETLLRLREAARVVIAIGACATTAGIPGMAAKDVAEHARSVYGAFNLGCGGVAGRDAEAASDAHAGRDAEAASDAHACGFGIGDLRFDDVAAEVDVPAACGQMIAPRPVSAVIPVDYEVRCCPADFFDFVTELHRVLYGSNRSVPTSTLCGECKLNETGCFYAQGTMCLGLVTRAGCGARCVSLGRPCNGCAGLSPDANLPSARATCAAVGIPVERFDQALEMFNQVNPALGKTAL